MYGAAGKRGASTGESEVKFAISESSLPGPSAQFPAPLDAAARIVTEYLTRGDQGARSVAISRDGAKWVSVQKRENLPRDSLSSLSWTQGPIVRQLAPGGHRFEERVPSVVWVRREPELLSLASLSEDTWPWMWVFLKGNLPGFFLLLVFLVNFLPTLAFQ